MQIKSFYVRDKSNFPVACIATTKIYKSIVFTWSVWNPLDRFSKQRGREIAEGRLVTYSHIIYDEKITPYDIVESHSGGVIVTEEDVIGEDTQGDILQLLVDPYYNRWIPGKLIRAAKISLQKLAEKKANAKFKLKSEGVSAAAAAAE